eukprot:scaffold201906_cov29-Tisochrysis_lutea.AAC.5
MTPTQTRSLARQMHSSLPHNNPQPSAPIPGAKGASTKFFGEPFEKSANARTNMRKGRTPTPAPVGRRLVRKPSLPLLKMSCVQLLFSCPSFVSPPRLTL